MAQGLTIETRADDPEGMACARMLFLSVTFASA